MAEADRGRADKGSLKAQMFRSHLLVASIALVMALMVLGFAYYLSSRVDRLATDFVSVVEVSRQIQHGVQRSFAGLRGWMTLKDDRFLEERRQAWNDDIMPAMEIMRKKIGNSRATWEGADFERFAILLENLRESQWWVQDVAQTPGNEPARVAFQSDVEPVAEGMFSSIASLIAEEERLTGGDSRKLLLGRFAKLQNALAQAMLMLERFLVANDSGDKQAFLNRLAEFATLMEEIVTHDEPLTREQHQSLNVLNDNLPALTASTSKAIELRQSPQSNVAQWLLSTETVLIARKVVAISAAISRDARKAMWEEVATTNRFSRIGIVVYLLLITGTLAVVFIISRRRANHLVEPIKSLSEAAKEFAAGRLDKGITVDRDDELGQLSNVFNKMRVSVLEAKNRLVEINASLERRVEERTAAIKQVNLELEDEIDKREQARRKLKSYATELERSNRELQDFAHVASHDLQEPLRKVQAFGDRLKKKYAETLGDEGRDYLERMENAAQRMSVLISDLLAFSRLTTKARPHVPTDLGEVVKGVLSDLEVRIGETGADIEIGDLPTLDADPGQMRQLMQNLIGNALKFHRKDKPPTVKINGKRIDDRQPEWTEWIGDGDFVQIVIEDNGIGFEEQYAEKIFTIFQRLHGRDEYQGTGIGLAICRKIAERHGGSISAKSTQGEGTAFTLKLPLRQTQEEQAS